MRLSRAALALFAVAATGSFHCDNATCIDRQPDVGSVCLPTIVQSDQTFNIQVQEACGLCSTQPQCTATLVDGEVHVDLHAQLCNDGSITCDTNLCLQRIIQCTMPSLPAGDWPLFLQGNQVRVIRVRDGGLSNCQLP
ncbi:MAG TPA: hypothetical protein VG496_11030 [Myxococcales bacterium]|nr:hypothetical protein [Myxococcales bacterium]